MQNVIASAWWWWGGRRRSRRPPGAAGCLKPKLLWSHCVRHQWGGRASRLKQCGVTFRKMGRGAKIGSELMRTDLPSEQQPLEKVCRLSLLWGEKAERRAKERIRSSGTWRICFDHWSEKRVSGFIIHCDKTSLQYQCVDNLSLKRIFWGLVCMVNGSYQTKARDSWCGFLSIWVFEETQGRMHTRCTVLVRSCVEITILDLIWTAGSQLS